MSPARQHGRIVELLLEHGAEVKTFENKTFTRFEEPVKEEESVTNDPFQEALKKEQLKIASHLLKARAADIEARKVVVNTRKRKCS